MLLLVRDAKTGKILYEPPLDPDGESSTWLIRHKAGLGRASKNEWKIVSEVGPEFFETAEKHRQWHFEFNDHYNAYIWDLVPGDHFSNLYDKVHMVYALQLRTVKSKANIRRHLSNHNVAVPGLIFIAFQRLSWKH